MALSWDWADDRENIVIIKSFLWPPCMLISEFEEGNARWACIMKHFNDKLDTVNKILCHSTK